MKTSNKREPMEHDGDGNEKIVKKVYVPGLSRDLKRAEELVHDPKAYLLFHTFQTEYPCLSFDILSDSLGDNRQSYPMTAWLATGTQADKPKNNQLMVVRIANMHGNKKAIEAKEKEQKRRAQQQQNGEDEDSSSSSSEDESSEEDEEEDNDQGRGERGGGGGAKEPRMHSAIIPHYGGVNRIKCAKLGGYSQVCAVWNDQQKVQIWNLSPCIAAIEADIEPHSATMHKKMNNEKPLHSFPGHSAEGFALAWSPIQNGALASGDVHRRIFLWSMSEGGKWEVNQRALYDHQASVEDLAWSPNEESLLMSCSSDRTIRLWDVRAPAKQACVCTVQDAHESDVNVLSWNGAEPLVVSGGDDAALKVWSMRTIQYNQPVATFRHHGKPITSVEWSPHDSTVFMASGEDDQTTIWDLALEADDPSGNGEEEEEEDVAMENDGEESGGQSGPKRSKSFKQLPPQLLFIHQGQTEIKEVHWHKQCPGLAFTTALDGFNAFKTINA